MKDQDLFPPGRVLWGMRNGDLHPEHQKKKNEENGDKLRVFEVLDVEKIFDQIVFARNMLTCVPVFFPSFRTRITHGVDTDRAHMPHEYDRVLHDLL